MPSIAPQVAIVTGGARGIGRAIAERLAAQGVRVAIGDIDADLAQQVAEETPNVVALPLDVTDPASFDAFVADVEGTLGPVDVLVNNAGIMPIGPFLEHGPELARRTFDIDVHGVLNGMRSVLPVMLRQRRGHIVNIASTAGKVSTPGSVLYSGAKHAVVGISDAARQEYAQQGVHVTVVLPSFTNTELISGTKGLRGVPTVEPSDVADAVAAAIADYRPMVYVPGYLRASAVLHEILPAAANDLLAKVYRADRVFLEVDGARRKNYTDRIDPASRDDTPAVGTRNDR